MVSLCSVFLPCIYFYCFLFYYEGSAPPSVLSCLRPPRVITLMHFTCVSLLSPHVSNYLQPPCVPFVLGQMVRLGALGSVLSRVSALLPVSVGFVCWLAGLIIQR